MSRNIRELKVRKGSSERSIPSSVRDGLKSVASTFRYVQEAEIARTLSKPNGHGFFAEMLFNAQRNVLGESSQVINSLGRKFKDSGDVISDGVVYQVKMHKTAASTLAAVTDTHGNPRYLNSDGSEMVIIVADDQVEYLREHGINAEGIGHSAKTISEFTSVNSASCEYVLVTAFDGMVSSGSFIVGAVSGLLNVDHTASANALEKIVYPTSVLKAMEHTVSRNLLQKVVQSMYETIKVGITFGIMSVIFRAAMSIVSILSAYLSKHYFGYTTSGVLYLGFVGLMALTIFISVWKKKNFFDAVRVLFESIFWISLSVFTDPVISGVLKEFIEWIRKSNFVCSIDTYVRNIKHRYTMDVIFNPRFQRAFIEASKGVV